MSSWDSVQRTKATLAHSVHDQTLVRRAGKVCKGVATVQRHERRVEGLACIVAGAAIGSDSEMQRFESFHYPRAQARGGGPEPEELEAQDRPAGAPLAPDRTLRAAGRSWRSPFKPTRSGKLGYELLKFGLRPSAT